MVDTVILRVLNLSKYPTLYEQYYAPTKRKDASTIFRTDIDTGEITEALETSNYIFHDTNRILPLCYRSNIGLSSSHYSVAYSLNMAGDYLELNFSIPKYLFATNVMQFINIHDQSTHATFLQLKSFLLNFVKENFIVTPLYEDIEINRIDLCYNQFFNSKEDALYYLDEQKKLLAKYARSSKNNFRTYDTSLLYVTKRYSFKIYHKGTEFRKTDYKELVNSKSKGLHDDLTIQYLLDQSDCILRYEMTFRKAMLNYLTNHYFFVSKTEVLYPQYSQHVLSRTFRQLVLFGHKLLYEKYKKRHKSFTIKSVFDTTNDLHYLYNADTITFDETLFTILHKVFYKKILDYQIQNILSPGEIINKLDRQRQETQMRNSLRHAGINKKLTMQQRAKQSKSDKVSNNLRMLSLALLSHYMNIEELKQFLPQSTFYDMKRDLKKLGVRPGDVSLQIPVPRLDYLDYKIYFQKFH